MSKISVMLSAAVLVLASLAGSRAAEKSPYAASATEAPQPPTIPPATDSPAPQPMPSFVPSGEQVAPQPAGPAAAPAVEHAAPVSHPSSACCGSQTCCGGDRCHHLREWFTYRPSTNCCGCLPTCYPSCRPPLYAWFPCAGFGDGGSHGCNTCGEANGSCGAGRCRGALLKGRCDNGCDENVKPCDTLNWVRVHLGMPPIQ